MVFRIRSEKIIICGEGLIVYIRNGLNAKRRKDLETNNIPYLWPEIIPINCKPFLVGNIYRRPDSKVEFNDSFEEFIDQVINEDKEYILMGDFNKNLLNVDTNIEWCTFTTSLGLTQLIDEPTRVTTESQTLIDHIYTNTEENVQCVAVKKYVWVIILVFFFYSKIPICRRQQDTSSHKIHVAQTFWCVKISPWLKSCSLGN